MEFIKRHRILLGVLSFIFMALPQAVDAIWSLAERIQDSKAHVMVQHADETEEAEKLKATIDSRFDCSELLLTEFSSGMGVHCGPGLLAVSFYTE